MYALHTSMDGCYFLYILLYFPVLLVGIYLKQYICKKKHLKFYIYFKNYAKKCEAKILERISSKGKGCMYTEPRSVSILLSLFML